MTGIPLGSDSDHAEEIRRLLQEFRRAIEKQDWPKLNCLTDSRHVWVEDRMITLEEFGALLQELTDGKVEVDILFHDLLESTISETEAKVSFNAKMLATDPETWEETEEEFDFHFGFERQGPDRWVISYLGLTDPTEGDPREHATGSEDHVVYPDPINDYVSPHPRIDVRKNVEAPNELVTVYLPVIMPRSLAQNQLSQSRGGL